MFQALPDDLKTKLSLDDDTVSSPKEALSRASADSRMKYLHGYPLVLLLDWLYLRKRYLRIKTTYVTSGNHLTCVMMHV